jgi:hypothetical protein
MEVIDEFDNAHIDSDDEEASKQMTKWEIKITPKFREYMIEHNVL